MNKVIDKGFRSCRFVSTIVKHRIFLGRCRKSNNIWLRALVHSNCL